MIFKVFLVHHGGITYSANNPAGTFSKHQLKQTNKQLNLFLLV